MWGFRGLLLFGCQDFPNGYLIFEGLGEEGLLGVCVLGGHARCLPPEILAAMEKALQDCGDRPPRVFNFCPSPSGPDPCGSFGVNKPNCLQIEVLCCDFSGQVAYCLGITAVSFLKERRLFHC